VAAGRQFTRGRGRLGSRRETSWLSIDFAAANAASTAVITHIMTAAELAKRPFTVIRTHLEVSVAPDQVAANEDQLSGIGMCLVSDQAAAIGVSAVPTPVTDLASDLWFLIQPMLTEFVFSDATGLRMLGTRFSIDSKAMRKVNEDEQIIVVVENSGLGGGNTFLIAGRLLVKES